MRLLASAFSCCPGHGSEPGVGWNTVEQLAKEHEVWVLVNAGWRERVERALEAMEIAQRAPLTPSPLPNGEGDCCAVVHGASGKQVPSPLTERAGVRGTSLVVHHSQTAEPSPSPSGRGKGVMGEDVASRIHLEFVGIPLLSGLVEKFPGNGAVWWLYYYLWQFAALLHAWKLHQRIGFEVSQHVTFVKYNTPSLLHLLGIPFIFGPVGGSETAPLEFFREFGWKTRLMETARLALIKLARFDPWLRWCVRRSALCLGVTEDTAQELRKLGAKRVEVLPAVALSDEEVAQIQQAKSEGQRAKGGALTLLYVGRLIPWKGVHLGLRALAQCSDTTLRYRIIGDGPLRSWLEAEAVRLGIADRVEFCGALPRAQVLQAYASADGFLYPSLHDSGGNAVIEAMCAGLPVICLDSGGPGLIVSAECGWKLRVTSPNEVARSLSEALGNFATDAEARQTCAEAAQQGCQTDFRWSVRSGVVAAMISRAVDTSV